MKYFIRSVKYFIYFSVICTAIIGALVLIGAVEGDIDSIFQEGYRSIGKIAIFFAVVAGIYPAMGFITRNMAVRGTWDDIRQAAVRYMKEHRYELESESPDKITFRFKGIAGKLSRMYEDRITLHMGADGWAVEGLRKDVMRISTRLEHLLTSQGADEDKA